MAHEVEKMAYVGETPWHGLGNKLTVGAPLEVWAKEAGMDMELATVPVQNGEIIVPDKRIVYRTDTKAGLAVVGDRYKLVQPIQVLEFFRDYVGDNAQLETAGLLKEGRVYWALARLEGEINIGGDLIHPYMLLSSSCDGTTATTARMTAVRVVCNNTLTMANAGKADVTVRHNQNFCGEKMKNELEGLYASLKAHRVVMQKLAKMKVKDDNFAKELLAKILEGPRQVERVFELYKADGIGATDSDAAKGTRFGLLNAVTEYYDWQYGRTPSARLEQSWFGRNATNKLKAQELLLAA